MRPCVNLSVVPGASCRGACQKFFRFEADFIAGRIREEALLDACPVWFPVVQRLRTSVSKKGILDAGSPSSFWIVADMFHLSKVFYWNLVRTIRAHILFGSPTPNGAIAFHIMAKEYFSLVRYAAEQWVSRPVSVPRNMSSCPSPQVSSLRTQGLSHWRRNPHFKRVSRDEGSNLNSRPLTHDEDRS